jgi:hypothetical protein
LEGRTLSGLFSGAGRLGRLARGVAGALAIVALGANLAVPLRAESASASTVPSDPRFLEAARSYCSPSPETQAAVDAFVASPRHRVPQWAIDQARSGSSLAIGAARSDDGDQAVPSPSASAGSPSPSASGASPAPSDQASADASASPEASASASAGPSVTALPKPPLSPGEAIPPNSVYGTPFPSAAPLPSPSPSSSASAPVYLVRPTGSPSIPLAGTKATPTPPAQNGPTPVPTLGPNEIVFLGDHYKGSSDENLPADLDGNVHLFYYAGQIVGDHGHWDGHRYFTITGHTYLLNTAQDSVLYADSIVFDRETRRATLVNGRGESSEGVQVGRVHYAAQNLQAQSSGVTHGDHANFTTCERPHSGYHIESRTIDVFPHDKIIARKAVLFLGPLAIFYLPLLVIPLRDVVDPRRKASFVPLIGYDQLEGFYVKAKIGFGTTDTYYGYYRLEYFTKRGLGVGYTAHIGTNNHRRAIDIDSYTIDDHLQNARLTNVNVAETEAFSDHLRGQFGFLYNGDFGPGLSIPANQQITATIANTYASHSEILTFQRQNQGQLSNNYNLGFSEQLTLSPTLQETLNLAYTKYNSTLASSNTFSIDSLTHWYTKPADYTLTYMKTDYSQNPFGYDKVPELQINPHINFHGFRYPFQAQLTLGEYTEPQNHFSTQRAELDFNEPLYFNLGQSSFSASENIRQDYYGTGDAKGFEQENASLQTPLGNHIVNSITYNEQHPFGPPDVPFQLFDRLSSGSHSAQENLRLYNSDVYSFSLSDGTNFDRQAQPVSYQLNVRPSARSLLVVGGYFAPGSGNGFGSTNIQTLTPLGKQTLLEFTTNVDWKNHMRLEDKNVYLTQIVGDCYQLQLTYNQDLKTVNFNINLLAFPSQSLGLGVGGPSQSIIPQSFAFTNGT